MNKDTKIGLMVGAAVVVIAAIYSFTKKKGAAKKDNKKADTKLTEQPSAASFLEYVVTTDSTALNVRKSPDAASEIVGNLPKGSVVLINPSSVVGWSEYSKDGKTIFGYVSSKYVTVK